MCVRLREIRLLALLIAKLSNITLKAVMYKIYVIHHVNPICSKLIKLIIKSELNVALTLYCQNRNLVFE